jgi:hypothetical protein
MPRRAPWAFSPGVARHASANGTRTASFPAYAPLGASRARRGEPAARALNPAGDERMWLAVCSPPANRLVVP